MIRRDVLLHPIKALDAWIERMAERLWAFLQDETKYGDENPRDRRSGT